MNIAEQVSNLSEAGQRTVKTVTEASQRTLGGVSQSVKNYRPSWQTAGFVAIAAATGGVASAIVLKGALAVKAALAGSAALKAALASSSLTAPVTTAGTVGGGAAGLGLSFKQASVAAPAPSSAITPPAPVIAPTPVTTQPAPPEELKPAIGPPPSAEAPTLDSEDDKKKT